MEDQDKSGVDQAATNGAGAAEGAGETSAGVGDARTSESHNKQLDELTRAYERARDELNDAVRTLRAEIANVDIDQARLRARTWVDENPTLAVFLGIGAGIVTGRLLSNAFRSEPPALTDRARLRADRWASDAGGYANELSSALAFHLGRAARAAGEAGDYVAHQGADVAERVSQAARQTGEDVSRRAERLGKDFSKRASHAGHDVSKRAEDAADALASSTERSVHALEDAAQDLAKTLKKKSKAAGKKSKKQVGRGLEFSDTAVNAARTAVAAVVVKKVNDWMKAMR